MAGSSTQANQVQQTNPESSTNTVQPSSSPADLSTAAIPKGPSSTVTDLRSELSGAIVPSAAQAAEASRVQIQQQEINSTPLAQPLDIKPSIAGAQLERAQELASNFQADGQSSTAEAKSTPWYKKVGNFVSNTAGSIGNFVSEKASWAGDQISAGYHAVADPVSEFASNTWNSVKNSGVGKAVASGWNSLGNAVSSGWDKVSTLASDVVKAGSSMLSAIGNGLSSLGSFMGFGPSKPKNELFGSNPQDLAPKSTAGIFTMAAAGASMIANAKENAKQETIATQDQIRLDKERIPGIGTFKTKIPGVSEACNNPDTPASRVKSLIREYARNERSKNRGIKDQQLKNAIERFEKNATLA